ncbi:hypothetical protein CEV32_0534 [Brucella rhizosphaerae]|uniref:Uncharacterized protein n=1 Tax=Brucella rhizosphaerae TaxID=571254 RepID=A0A256FI68_9HYPH|nr:hypothetical protein CEV32_0534 [Brucella rhizosphaerae]
MIRRDAGKKPVDLRCRARNQPGLPCSQTILIARGETQRVRFREG